MGNCVRRRTHSRRIGVWNLYKEAIIFTLWLCPSPYSYHTGEWWIMKVIWISAMSSAKLLVVIVVGICLVMPAVHYQNNGHKKDCSCLLYSPPLQYPHSSFSLQLPDCCENERSCNWVLLSSGMRHLSWLANFINTKGLLRISLHSFTAFFQNTMPKIKRCIKYYTSMRN